MNEKGFFSLLKNFFNWLRKTVFFYYVCILLKLLFLIFENLLKIKLCDHLWFNGKFRLKIDKYNSLYLYNFGYLIENRLFWYGINGYESQTIKYWLRFSKISSVIVDVGANTGIFSLLAYAVQPNARVICFEPVQRIYEKCLHQIKLNNFHIETYNYALSDKTGYGLLYDYDFEHAYASSLTVVDSTLAHRTDKIITYAFDDFIEREGVGRVDLMKIDVEVHEYHVLAGYTKWLKKHLPVIFIEILYDEAGNRIQDLLENDLKLRYKYFFIDENKGLIETKIISRMSDVFFNYLFIPEEKWALYKDLLA